jgi:hypothetical protein
MLRFRGAVLVLLLMGCRGGQGERLLGDWTFTVTGLCANGSLSLTSVDSQGFSDVDWGTWSCDSDVGHDVEVAVYDNGDVLVIFLKKPRTVIPYVYQWPGFSGTWTDNGIEGTADDGTGTVLHAVRAGR